MRASLVVILIPIIDLVAMAMPASAQYYSNSKYYSGNGYHQNGGSYGGIGGNQNNHISGFHSLASTSAATANNRMSAATFHHPSQASQTSMKSFEHALDEIDTPQAWSRTPVAKPATRSTYHTPSPVYSKPVPSGGMLPGVTRRDITRVMMEGGSLFDSGGGGMTYDTSQAQASRAAGTTYSHYQRAENAATRAHSAANRARYDREKWSKKDAADEAYYAANDADAAADAAEASAASGDSQARGYANQARGAANRARADANRARYNANTEY